MHMIERVARACYRNAYPDVREDELNFDGLPQPRHELYINMARAAIESMREPTGAMKSATYLLGWEADEIWEGMIDAALKESPDGSL
ncbi:hypothetical protein G6L12_05950 [Agrobacterium rhizogenes]|nr:hypothetical protein [Rhizobium rhizogenes]NTF74018.1 hypothetical protein [Rhizobium rhizogenes]